MIALVLAAALGATPITLDEVREQSRRNTQVLLSELERARAGEQLRTARSAIYPSAALNAGTSLRYTGPQRTIINVPLPGGGSEQQVREQPEFTAGGFDLTLSLQQLIYDGGKSWSRIEQAGAQEEAARGQLDEQRLTAELEGTRRFYELYRSQERQAVLDANLARTQDQVGRAEGLFEAGRVGKGELLSSRVNLGNDRILLLQQRTRIAGAQAELAAWLSRPPSEELVAQAPALSSTPSGLPLEEALELARGRRPLYRALEAQVRSATAAIAIARGDYFPRVAAQVAVGRQGPTADPFFTDPSRQNLVTGGINLRWELFSGFATDAQTQVAHAQRRAAELNLEAALRELEAELKKALTSLEVQLEANQIAEANRALAGEALTVAEGRFAQGAGSTLEVRDAQLKLTQAELTLLESRIDTELARAYLERVLGGSMTGAFR